MRYKLPYRYDAKSSAKPNPTIIYWRVDHRLDGGSEIQISKNSGSTWYTVKCLDVSCNYLLDPQNTMLGDMLVFLMTILTVVYDDHYELREWK